MCVARFPAAAYLALNAHCIQVAVGWNGIPQIYSCSPPGVTSFFRAGPRGREIYFDNKVVPGGTKDVNIGPRTSLQTSESICTIPGRIMLTVKYE